MCSTYPLCRHRANFKYSFSHQSAHVGHGLYLHSAGVQAHMGSGEVCYDEGIPPSSVVFERGMEVQLFPFLSPSVHPKPRILHLFSLLSFLILPPHPTPPSYTDIHQVEPSKVPNGRIRRAMKYWVSTVSWDQTPQGDQNSPLLKLSRYCRSKIEYISVARCIYLPGFYLNLNTICNSYSKITDTFTLLEH